jgi:multisubunit Na+/H+ antiporter MnhB subunit
MAQHVPLTSGFMLTSIIGFLVSVFFVWKLSENWGFTFGLFFVIMFIASVINMSHIEAEDKYGLEELAIHEKGHYAKKRNKK